MISPAPEKPKYWPDFPQNIELKIPENPKRMAPIQELVILSENNKIIAIGVIFVAQVIAIKLIIAMDNPTNKIELLNFNLLKTGLIVLIIYPIAIISMMGNVDKPSLDKLKINQVIDSAETTVIIPDKDATRIPDMASARLARFV
ncbi:hypothetical protein NG799_05160 [Laspinema sp. D1]|uniref:Uncharacterized protein n=1 Tax=Laspinema palackyanum D2a TaxID=2953684 RepID=A0ABT2MLX3_9CYAN|nr:hypothetical protein [Laspinema sp. D2a]